MRLPVATSRVPESAISLQYQSFSRSKNLSEARLHVRIRKGFFFEKGDSDEAGIIRHIQEAPRNLPSFVVESGEDIPSDLREMRVIERGFPHQLRWEVRAHGLRLQGVVNIVETA